MICHFLKNPCKQENRVEDKRVSTEILYVRESTSTDNPIIGIVESTVEAQMASVNLAVVSLTVQLILPRDTKITVRIGIWKEPFQCCLLFLICKRLCIWIAKLYQNRQPEQQWQPTVRLISFLVSRFPIFWWGTLQSIYQPRVSYVRKIITKTNIGRDLDFFRAVEILANSSFFSPCCY